jgi:hypothetical protein
VDVLPLALDDSGDPAQARRASQKLLADPQVVAVVGPLLLDAIPAVATVITPSATIPWYVPALSAPPNAFAVAGANAWLAAQVDYVATHAPATRVLLLGMPAEWRVAIESTVATLRVDDLDSAAALLAEGDALLWLGRPDVGARWLAALRPDHPESQFWLAPQAGMDVFALHSADHTHVYSLFWAPSDYNASSQPDDSAIPPSDALRHSTYHATCAALLNLHEQELVEQEPMEREANEQEAREPARWQVQSQPIEQPRIP